MKQDSSWGLGKRVLSTLAAAVVFSSATVHGTDILAIAYSDGVTGDPGIDHLRQSLVATGLSVDWTDGGTPGLLAAKLASGSYTSIFIYDITTTGGLFDGADAAALAGWYNPNGKSVVFDGRSYGSYFQGQPGMPDDLFLQNIAINFDQYGGGLWIGADDTPTWSKNANAALTSLNFNPFTGSHSDPITGGSGPYLAGPNVINPFDLQWAYTASYAPIGLQPNGVTLTSLVDVTNGSVISYNFIPAPGAFALLGLGALIPGRRRRRCSLTGGRLDDSHDGMHPTRL